MFRFRDARQLAMKAKKEWKDAWWRIGKVADYHKVNHRQINVAIHTGRLRATQWGNWWVLRSDAKAFRIWWKRREIVSQSAVVIPGRKEGKKMAGKKTPKKTGQDKSKKGY